MLLSGGADACVTPGMMFGFSRMKVVSMAYNDQPQSASRPFDKGRDGFVLGEGAWMMAVEREDRARARGATIYASMDGYASTCDAYHRVQMAPDGEEIVRALALAHRAIRAAEGDDRLRQLPRHVDGAQRRRRVAVRARGVRRLRRSAGGIVGEVDDRPSAGRERRRGHRHLGARAQPRLPAADDQPARSRSRAATSTSSRTTAARPRSRPRSATASASGRRTARS